MFRPQKLELTVAVSTDLELKFAEYSVSLVNIEV